MPTKTRTKPRTKDSTGTMLEEMGKIPLLTAEEEVVLGKAIKQGIQAQERVAQGEPLTEELKKLIAAGDRARRKMIEANLRLVVSIAKKYQERGLDLQDMIQEGALGLNRAAEKFDYERGYKFSTYATWWIRQAITRAIGDKARNIRLPIHTIDKLNRLKKAYRKLYQTLKRTPTKQELADEIGISLDALDRLLEHKRDIVSLNQKVGREDEHEILEFISNKSSNGPMDEAIEEEKRQIVENLMHSCLQPREILILTLRYGLDGSMPRTLVQVGAAVGVTRERVRQIQERAMRKLRQKVSRLALAGKEIEI